MQRMLVGTIGLMVSCLVGLPVPPALGADPDGHDAERGRAMQERVYADVPPDDPWLKMSQEHLFGQIWTRPGLTMKERRLISLSVASAVGSRPGFASHLRGALESGDLSESEIWEWLIHFTQYAGYFKAAPVWSEYRALLAERGSMPLPERGVDAPAGDQSIPPSKE